jgi:hypothetical protein
VLVRRDEDFAGLRGRGPGGAGRRRREGAVAALEAPDQAAPSGQDDSLALLLMCCHPVLPVPSQLALTLRAVGGVAPLVDVLPRRQVSAFQPLLTRWSHSNIEP